MKTIENKIQSELPKISWTELKTFQFNDLKDSKNRDVSKLKNSIVNEGYCFPLFVWKRYVLDGTGRYLALKELESEGYEIPELPFIEINANNLQHAKKLALMASSRHGNITQKSFEAFTADLQIEDIRLDICLPEIKLEVANLKLEENEVVEPEEESNDEEVEQITKPGDLWELNEHRIFCGDCLDKRQIEILMNNQTAEMVFIDPPYNLKASAFCGKGETQHKDFKKAAGELKEKQFTEFLKDVFKNLVNVSRDGSIHYVCMDWRHLYEILEAGNACYTELKNLCIWAKDQPGQGSFYRSQHEMVFVFKNGKAKHINNFELGQFGRTRSNVWNYPSAISFGNEERKDGGLGEFANHPTPKPVNLVADCILDCSSVNGIILDTFLGSGTSLIASQKTKRTFYGMELEPNYVDCSVRRWVKFMEKENLDYELKLNGEVWKG
jgi:DNA modification methylase